MTDGKLHHFFYTEKNKSSLQLLCTSLCSGCHRKTSAGSLFYTFHKRAGVDKWTF